MVINLRQFVALVALVSAPLAGCAYANEPAPVGPYSEVLAELPANAPPGECYAKVIVPGERVEAPPVQQGAVWVVSQTPAGPIYCLVPTGPVVQPVVETISRYGWIRVLCDQDATPERITRVQTRLHERGYYRGQVSGRYDRATAEALSHFQTSAHIEHGGYLSLETLQALDAQATYASAAPVMAQQPATYGYASAYGYQAAAAYAPAYAPQFAGVQFAGPCGCEAAYAPPPPPPQIYYQQAYAPPCCAAPAPPPQAYPCCVGAQTYGYSQGVSGGYGFGAPAPAYAAASAQAYAGSRYGYASAHASARVSTVQNGWLMWSGKSGY